MDPIAQLDEFEKGALTAISRAADAQELEKVPDTVPDASLDQVEDRFAAWLDGLPESLRGTLLTSIAEASAQES